MLASDVSEELLQKVALELHAADPVRSEIPAPEAFTICTVLQLALRHPGLSGMSKAIAEKAARDLQAAIGRRSPTAGQLLELGWNPACDVAEVG